MKNPSFINVQSMYLKLHGIFMPHQCAINVPSMFLEIAIINDVNIMSIFTTEWYILEKIFKKRQQRCVNPEFQCNLNPVRSKNIVYNDIGRFSSISSKVRLDQKLETSYFLL